MSLDEYLGRRVTLAIRRFGSPGAILALGENEDILLLGPEIPEGAKEGDEVEVFVHLDSEGRPLATTRPSKLELGEIAFLRVTAVTQIGAFVDWGLAKELLVPFKEQTTDVNVGGRYPIGLYVDDTGRLAGTMRVSELLDNSGAKWTEDEWVEGEAWREDPAIGLFVIVERRYVGLVPRDEPHGLSRGEAARFRVTNVLRDGRIELSRRGLAHQELNNDGMRIVQVISGKDAPAIGDKSSPEQIRDLFGLSKKAFKRAVGRLLKDGNVVIDEQGNIRPKSR